MKNHEIYIIEGTAYRELTIELLEKADLAERIPDKSCRIGIKPNLVSPSEPSWGATTHPEVVAGIIEYLQARGYDNLVVLESSWVGAKTAESLQANGLDRVLKQYGVPFCDTQKDRGYAVDAAGLELHLCESVKEIDFLINVPVMKGHCQTKITCALKNMKGLIPNKEKRRFHAMGLHRPIAHLNAAIHQDFVVVDAICGDWDFEDGGNPRVLNRIMAAADPVLCDTFVCDFMGFETNEVPYITQAEKLGVGSDCLESIRVVPCGSLQNVLASGAGEKVVKVKDAVEEVESCSACYGYLIPALDRLREEGLLEKLGTKICIGQGYRGKSGCLGIGSCTSRFDHSLRGCPPMPDEIYDFLADYIFKNNP